MTRRPSSSFKLRAGLAGDGVEPLAELWSENTSYQPLLESSLHGREECEAGVQQGVRALARSEDRGCDWWRPPTLYVAFTYPGGAKLGGHAVDRFRISDEGLILRRDSYWDLSRC